MLHNRKDAEMMSIRLENVTIMNKLKKQESQLKSQVFVIILYSRLCVCNAMLCSDLATG